MHRFMLAFLALCLLAGCQQPSIQSMNIQRATLHGVAVPSVATALDSVSDDRVAQVLADTRAGAQAITDFLNDGQVAHLAEGVFRQKIDELLAKWPEARYVADAVLVAVSSQVVDPSGAIGARNVERCRAVAGGVLASCDMYRIEDRPVKDPAQ